MARPEFILCAAIYVDTGFEEPLRRSYSYPKTGLVFAAWRHGDCYTTFNAWKARLTEKEIAGINAIDPDQIHGSRQGFLTSSGRFVNREEAYMIALAAGQLIDGADCADRQKSPWLMSEDIY